MSKRKVDPPSKKPAILTPASDSDAEEDAALANLNIGEGSSDGEGGPDGEQGPWSDEELEDLEDGEEDYDDEEDEEEEEGGSGDSEDDSPADDEGDELEGSDEDGDDDLEGSEDGSDDVSDDEAPVKSAGRALIKASGKPTRPAQRTQVRSNIVDAGNDEDDDRWDDLLSAREPIFF